MKTDISKINQNVALLLERTEHLKPNIAGREG